jgi:hypothetical protein
MRSVRLLLVLALSVVSVVWLASTVNAAGPRNPYSSFNLSGINYGAQQWDRAQREGRVVWPYYNVPSRGYSRNSGRGSGVSVGSVIAGGGGAGTIIQGSNYRSAPRSYSSRTYRRWRR